MNKLKLSILHSIFNTNTLLQYCASDNPMLIQKQKNDYPKEVIVKRVIYFIQEELQVPWAMSIELWTNWNSQYYTQYLIQILNYKN